jgi:hypothetical protein
MRNDLKHVILSAITAIVAVLLLAHLTGCCSAYYRYDGERYYKAVECPWGKSVECDSATRLPDPATWTEGCR